jgi:hypothetical protein
MPSKGSEKAGSEAVDLTHQLLGDSKLHAGLRTVNGTFDAKTSKERTPGHRCLTTAATRESRNLQQARVILSYELWLFEPGRDGGPLRN